jgi:hypothetical protein
MIRARDALDLINDGAFFMALSKEDLGSFLA